jgi:hypothetical protein
MCGRARRPPHDDTCFGPSLGLIARRMCPEATHLHQTRALKHLGAAGALRTTRILRGVEK